MLKFTIIQKYPEDDATTALDTLPRYIYYELLVTPIFLIKVHHLVTNVQLLNDSETNNQ